MKITSVNDNGSELNVIDLVAAMQCMSVGVTIIDRTLTIKFWNNAFCQHLDFPNELMRPGVSMEELFYFNARRGVRCTVNSGHVRFKQPAPFC